MPKTDSTTERAPGGTSGADGSARITRDVHIRRLQRGTRCDCHRCQTPVADDAPVMVAWKAYQQTDGYANTRRWAQTAEHVDGSLWAAFEHGFRAAQNAELSFKKGAQRNEL